MSDRGESAGVGMHADEPERTAQVSRARPSSNPRKEVVMNRIPTSLLVLCLLLPGFSLGGTQIAVAEVTAETSWAPSASSIVASPSPAVASATASMSPEMQQMMSLMDRLMSPEAMRLHMELMSPEMKAMMAEMMGSTSDTSSTVGGEHDHAGHTTGASIHRFDQTNLIDRAVALSRSTYETGTVKSAVLANGGQYYEVLSAAALAGTIKGPLLPSSAGSVATSVIAELRRLGVRQVYIVGTTGHVSLTVQRRLTTLGFAVARVAGTDGYATAAAVTRKVASLRGARTIPTVLVVNFDRPWDAVTVLPYAYARNIPVLFVNGSGVPVATSRAISDLKVQRAIVVGSGISIKDATYRSVARMTTATDTRIAADTRWALADRLARFALARTWVSAAHPVVVNGILSVADALVAGSHAGAQRSVLLLTPSDSLPRTARVFINEYRTAITHPVVAGTTSSVANMILTDIQSLLQTTSH